MSVCVCVQVPSLTRLIHHPTPHPTPTPNPTRLLERDIPVDITTIKGKYLREHIAKNGCCGATELLKLYAWLLTDYHRVVHLDMDSMVVQPMDELYDMEGKDFLYTCDYGMMTKGSKACPVQGGFFVLRPNEADYQGLLATVKEGDFREGSAWGGEGIGWFWGGMTIQGTVKRMVDVVGQGTQLILSLPHPNPTQPNPKACCRTTFCASPTPPGPWRSTGASTTICLTTRTARTPPSPA